ncbi:LUD domain-containing protein [Aureimonas sp. AU4]|uniref:LutC/YkgG family protein n=1 Tax=Aureimonas sp. AU4 TaxID=1638163 RepID=UPI0007846F62|nr:LUD domain-containing protein [Aureimonas sp. AU4]
MTGARERVLGAVRAALSGTPRRPADEIASEARRLLDEPERVRPVLPPGEPVALFEAAVARLPPGASMERVDGWDALPARVAARLASLGAGPALKLAPEPVLTRLDWRRAGVELVEDANERAALSLAECAVAETGSLLLRSGPRMAVLDAFLPLHHLVAVRASDVLRHLEDAVARADLARSRNLVVVTGPSGTTDIEGSLVIGVHGPATLHILVVGNAA